MKFLHYTVVSLCLAASASYLSGMVPRPRANAPQRFTFTTASPEDMLHASLTHYALTYGYPLDKAKLIADGAVDNNHDKLTAVTQNQVMEPPLHLVRGYALVAGKPGLLQLLADLGY